MELNGREVNFRRTIWADKEIAKMCPGGNIRNIDKILGGENFAEQIEVSIKMICILSEAYEKSKKFGNPDYVMAPITAEEVEILDEDVYTELVQNMMGTFAEDGKGTVKTEPIKKNVTKAKR